MFESVGTLLRPRPLVIATRRARPGPRRWPAATGTAPIAPAEVRALCPVLRPEWTQDAMIEPSRRKSTSSACISTSSAAPGAAVCACTCHRGARRPPRRRSLAPGHHRRARCGSAAVVDAAGAWADVVAARLGVEPVGLTPLVRTAAVARYAAADQNWPLVGDLDETFYFRPEGQGLLISPADETPADPHDARAEELGGRARAGTGQRGHHAGPAFGVHRLGRAAHVHSGPRPGGRARPAEPTFCWLAGQGGFGIQTAPELAPARGKRGPGRRRRRSRWRCPSAVSGTRRENLLRGNDDRGSAPGKPAPGER